MEFIVAKRAVVLIPSPSATSPLWMPHPFIVLTDPFPLTGCANSVVLATLSSVKLGVNHDKTCELQVGCHSAIVKPSFVRYARTRVQSAIQIEQGVAKGAFTPMEEFPLELFETIGHGLLSSPLTSLEIKELYARVTGKD